MLVFNFSPLAGAVDFNSIFSVCCFFIKAPLIKRYLNALTREMLLSISALMAPSFTFFRIFISYRSIKKK